MIQGKEIDVEELRKAIEQFDPSDGKPLRQAAVKWAEFCLWKLTGAALDRGLAVSSSIAMFLNELNDPKCEKEKA